MSQASKLNTLQYNRELCTGCEMCCIVCPHAVFTLQDGIAEIFHYEACMECGACQLNCPTSAITVESGVGCAYLMIRSALTRRKATSCCT